MKKRALSLAVCLLLLLGCIPAEAADTQPPYYFKTPSMSERLTYSPDGKTAALFAPYVTRESGWYDTNKNWRNDVRLCWAASCSNVIAWYLDACEKTGYWDVSGVERDVDRIFDRFRASWDYMEGQDPIHGMNWYFTGGFSSGEWIEGLTDRSSGGYLRAMPHCQNGAWYVLDPVNEPGVFGDYSGQFPMLNDQVGKYYENDPFYDLASFSETVISQLTLGVGIIGVSAAGAFPTGSHAITLWGCDYEVDTGLVTAIYVTDSDDEDRVPGHSLKRLAVTAKNPDREGIRLQDYYLSGSPAPVTEFLNSMLFYAPGVVTKEKPDGVQLTWKQGVRISGADRGTRVILAAYDEEERLLDTCVRTADASAGGQVTIPVPWTQDVYRIRAFAQNESGQPLCQALEHYSVN